MRKALLYGLIGFFVFVGICTVLVVSLGEPSEPSSDSVREGATQPVATIQQTAAPEPSEAATSTATPIPTSTPTPVPTATPTPTATPVPGWGPGTLAVGRDIEPGIYAGKAGLGVFDSCYWARLRGVSGDLSDIIANDNAIGQFYISVSDSDEYLEVACRITPLSDWPEPEEPPQSIEPGIHLVGRDITPGTYQGEAGTGVLESCYWGRLSGLSGGFDDIIANDNAIGSFYVSVLPTDTALSTHCALERVEE